MIKIWNPQIFLEPMEENTIKYAILILNRPIHLEPNYIKKLWNKGNIIIWYIIKKVIRICVDPVNIIVRITIQNIGIILIFLILISINTCMC